MFWQPDSTVLGKGLRPLLIAVCLASFSAPGVAAEWRGSTGLKIGETYSDNVRLDSEDEKSEWTTVITPNISLTGKGARADVSLMAAVEFNTLGGDADSVNPQLQADAGVEVVEDFFFIDADASARQTSIDPYSSYGFSNLNERDNRTTTYDYSISPYISTRFKDYATLLLRYNYDSQINRDDDLDDSDRESATFSLRSGREFGRFDWGINGNYSKTDFDDDEGRISATDNSDNEFISSSVDLGYQLNRKWRVTSTFGKEWNDFISDDDIDDTFWEAGIVWNPTKRTNLKLGFGERYFGDTPSLDFTHSHKRSTFKLSYEKELTDSRSLRTRGDVFSAFDSFGDPVNPFTDDILRPSRNFTSAENATLVNEEFDASIELKGNRTTVTLDARRSKQVRQDNSDESVFSGYSISADRRLSSKLSLDLRYSWDHREERDTDEESTTSWYDVSLRREIGPNTSISIQYSYTDRDSDLADDDYSENRFSLYLSTKF